MRMPIPAFLAMIGVLGCQPAVRRLTALHEFAADASAASGQATAIAWSADAKMIAWGDGRGVVHIGDVQTGRELARADGYVRHAMEYDVTGLAARHRHNRHG